LVWLLFHFAINIFASLIDFAKLLFIYLIFVLLLAILRLLFEKIAFVACGLITIFAYVMIMAGFFAVFRESYHWQCFYCRDRAIEAD
jgi:hypothetical protein